MTEQEFLKELSENLQGVPREERERSLTFYREILADKRDEGLSEEAAVASVGKPEQVAKEIVWAYYQGEGAPVQESKDAKAPNEPKPKEEDKQTPNKEKNGKKFSVGRLFALFGWAVLGIVILSVWLALPACALVGAFAGLVELFSGEFPTALWYLGLSPIAAVGTVFALKLVKAYLVFLKNFTKKTFGGLFARD